MVPEGFHDDFVASTGIGAALVELLFVAVSIAPERTVMSGAPVDRQAVATSAYTTLLNQKEGKILDYFVKPHYRPWFSSMDLANAPLVTLWEPTYPPLFSCCY